MDSEYLTSKDWGELQTPKISPRMAVRYCSEGRIQGAKKFGNESSPRSHWMIPKLAKIQKFKQGAKVGNQNAKKTKTPIS